MPISRRRENRQLALINGTPAERFDMGRAHRDSVPLDVHAELPAKKDRADPLAILGGQDELRVPQLIPLRYGRMSVSPFTFLRGAAAVMASDLAAGQRTNIWAELCGDAHLGNFRWYNAPNRGLVFDINDFDETLPGPFEWDVKRLAASITVAGRNNGFSTEKCRAATRTALRDYRSFMAEASEMTPLDLYFYRFGSEAALARLERQGSKHRKWKEAVIAKASQKTHMRAFKKLTGKVDGESAILPDPPRIMRVDEEVKSGTRGGVEGFLKRYRNTLPFDRRLLMDRFTLVDFARKVVGVGSVGTRCFILLLESGDGTPMFLQVKEAVDSVLEPYLGASVFRQSGQRVVEGQRLIQATSDVLLGWAQWKTEDGESYDFYLRQLWDGKGKIDVEDMTPKRLAIFAGLCGKTLAFAHARSGDPMMIRGYIGDEDDFDDIMVAFAERYADLTEKDHALMGKAIKDGAIEVDLEG